MQPSPNAVLAALGNVIDPELRKPITELDMVRDITIDGGDVSVRIALTVVGCPLRSSFQDQVAKEVGDLEGVSSVRLDFDVMTIEAAWRSAGKRQDDPARPGDARDCGRLR
jgi:ATP-binding protein involved in chromosome partitioning